MFTAPGRDSPSWANYFALFGYPGMWATPGDNNAHLETQYATSTIPKSYVAKYNSGLMQNCKDQCKTPHSSPFRPNLFWCDYVWQRVNVQRRWGKSVATWWFETPPYWGGVWKCSDSAPPLEHSCMATAQRWHALQSKQLQFSLQSRVKSTCMHSGPEVQAKRRVCRLFLRKNRNAFSAVKNPS